MSLERGTQLGDYSIVSRIGTGAYGEVYESEHAITRRRDAIKVLVDDRLHSAEEQERFLQEIQVQASLHHPNIAAVYNAFLTPHGLALVMELVRGEPLSAILAQGRLPLERGVRLVQEVLAALAYAHAQGIVHRDVKPENIIVTPDGSVKLTDFGLARSTASPRLSQSGVLAGSPCYMSPEQARGTTAPDARSDTYSAGVVLYEVVTGQLPFTGDSTFEVLLEHQYSPPAPPEEVDPAVSPALSQVILTALEKEPERRYQTAGAFYAALEEAARCDETVEIAAPHEIAPARPRIPSRTIGRRRWITLAACASVVLSAGAVGAVVRHWKTGLPAIQTLGAKVTSNVMQAVRLPIAGTPDAAPVPASGGAASAPQPNPVPPTRPRPQGRIARAVSPAPSGLRFVGAAAEEPAAPARGEIPPARLPEPSHSEVAVSRAPEPAVTTPAAPEAQPERSDAAAVETESSKEAAPKRRNVMVRVFQKMFRQHPKASGVRPPAASGEASEARPSGNDNSKQPEP